MPTDNGELFATCVRCKPPLDSAPRQLWLGRTLGLQTPEYTHVPLLLAGYGRRLAKRDHDMEMGQLQSLYTASELVGKLAYLAGIIPEYEPVTPVQLISSFSWNNIIKNDHNVLKATGSAPVAFCAQKHNPRQLSLPGVVSKISRNHRQES